MVEIVNIKDKASLRDWLEKQPQEMSVWIAHRCAMRLLPEWWHFVLNSFVAKHAELSALPTLQRNLISGFASKMFTAEAKRVANIAQVAEDDEIMGDIIEAALAASIEVGAFSDTTYSELSAATNASRAADNAIEIVNVAAHSGDAASIMADTALNLWGLIASDCVAIEAGEDPYSQPLWAGQKNQFEKKWKMVKKQLAGAMPSGTSEMEHETPTVDWSFWIKWYDDALDGNPPNWKMLERIALIAPKDWDKGAEIVNPLIAEIQLRYELKDQIATLEAKLQSASTAIRGMGDNQGPSMNAVVAKELLVIWEPLLELKQEVESEIPDKSKVLEIAGKLYALSIAMAKWVAGKVDKAVEAFVIAAGTGTAGLALVWYTQEASTVAGLLSKISELAGKWAGYLQ